MKSLNESVWSIEDELKHIPARRDHLKIKHDIGTIYKQIESHPLTTNKVSLFVRIITDTLEEAVIVNYIGRYDDLILTGIKFLQALYNDSENVFKQTFI
ncbi:hypothetical protein WHYPHY_2 [Bacillus phage WhyPhy]|uniref:Uncharacterized protein n=1 Tax=Bacillus phage WhyPhy TaxID=2801480 RepID=A0A7T7ZAM7_9CAUD|nr:hypothetical protein KNV75_gp02 [Bacillus phage WhyPhy]QQO40343.1 hypothetical protein WHYPHY_2 [Bacillus phage WhyPhy]